MMCLFNFFFCEELLDKGGLEPEEVLLLPNQEKLVDRANFTVLYYSYPVCLQQILF